MAVDMKLWIYFMKVDAKCDILWRLTWNKTEEVVNKLSSVRKTDWNKHEEDSTDGKVSTTSFPGLFHLKVGGKSPVNEVEVSNND